MLVSSAMASETGPFDMERDLWATEDPTKVKYNIIVKKKLEKTMMRIGKEIVVLMNWHTINFDRLRDH